MKNNNFTLRLKPFIVLMFAMLVGHTVTADIVGFTLTANSAATSGIAANFPGKGRVINTTGLTNNGYSVQNGHTCYGWNSVGSDCWTTSVFSTAGYVNLSVGYQMKANAASPTQGGPRNFKAQYSLDNSTWTDVPLDPAYPVDNPVITLTRLFVDHVFHLPSTCDNKTAVYVRWVQNSTVGITNATEDGGDGTIGINSTSNVSLKGVSIQGDPFAAPSTQASNISIISVTPTTITVSCTRGKGNNRILVMNTSYSFTNPVDDYNPTPNTTYGGAGEQVIYNGTGTRVTVNVSSSTNTYWFRYFDFNLMDALTRFNISTASINPKECALETIHTPTYASIGLTSATLGATITTPAKSTITERGVFWSLSPGVSEIDNLIPEASSSAGIFAVTGLVDRGTTIYFKGYVTNEAGTIMSSESSFSNIPIFTGTGNWETAARWNVNEVPGANSTNANGDATDNPLINGACTQTQDVICNDLTIGTSYSLKINPTSTLTVNGTLTNNGGTAGLVIKSDASGTGSLLEYTSNISATVERWLPPRMVDDTMAEYRYHFVSSPCTSQVSRVFEWSYLYSRNEATQFWINIPPTTTPLIPLVGYEIRRKHNTITKYWNKIRVNPSVHVGTLNSGNIGSVDNLTFTNTKLADWRGWNLVGNPYPCTIDWDADSSSGQPGWDKRNINNTIYFLNDDQQYATYVGGAGGWGINNGCQYITSQQGFWVRVRPGTAGASTVGTLMMGDGVKTSNNTGFFRSVPVENNLRLKITRDKMSDETIIRFSQNATANFDYNFDGYKLYGNPEYPQLFTVTADGEKAAINSLAESTLDSAKVPLNLKIGTSGKYTITANDLNSFDVSMGIALEDTKTKKRHLLTSNPVYSFSADTSDKLDRFIVWFYKSTSSMPHLSDNGVSIFSNNNTIFVDLNGPSYNSAELTIMNLLGQTVDKKQISSKNHTGYKTELPTGLYIVRVVVDGKYFDKKLFLEN